MNGGRPGLRWWWRVFTTLVRRPMLWTTALGQLLRLAVPRWWRRPPFLPLPDPGYLRFRLETQYGSDCEPEVGDVVDYLEWVRATARSSISSTR